MSLFDGETAEQNLTSDPAEAENADTKQPIVINSSLPTSADMTTIVCVASPEVTVAGQASNLSDVIVLSEITDPDQLTALEILGLGQCNLFKRVTDPTLEELNVDSTITHRAYIIVDDGTLDNPKKIFYFQRGKELRRLNYDDQKVPWNSSPFSVFNADLSYRNLKEIALLTNYSPKISKKEITKKYYELGLEYHPDKCRNKECDDQGNEYESDIDFERRKNANVVAFRVSTSAYEVLMNKNLPDPNSNEPKKDRFTVEARINAKKIADQNKKLPTLCRTMTVRKLNEFLKKNKDTAVIKQIKSHLELLEHQADKTKILKNIVRFIKGRKISFADFSVQSGPEEPNAVWSYLLNYVFNNDDLTGCLCSKVVPAKYKIFSLYQQYLYNKFLTEQRQKTPTSFIVAPDLMKKYEEDVAWLAGEEVAKYIETSHLIFMVEAYQWTREHYSFSVENLEQIPEDKRFLVYLLNCEAYSPNIVKKNCNDSTIPTPYHLEYDFSKKEYYHAPELESGRIERHKGLKKFLASLSINLSTISEEFSTKMLKRIVENSPNQATAEDFNEYYKSQQDILRFSVSVLHSNSIRDIYVLLKPSLAKQQKLQSAYDALKTASSTEVADASSCGKKLVQINIVIEQLKIHAANFVKEMIEWKAKTIADRQAIMRLATQKERADKIHCKTIIEQTHTESGAENYRLVNCCEKIIHTLQKYANAEEIGRHQNLIKPFLRGALGAAIITLLCSSVIGLLLFLSPKVREIMLTSFFYTATKSTLITAEAQAHHVSVKKMTDDGSVVIYSITSQILVPVDLLCKQLKAKKGNHWKQIELLESALDQVRKLINSRRRGQPSTLTFYGLVSHEERKKACREKAEAFCMQALNILKALVDLTPEVKKELDSIIEQAELFFSRHIEKAASNQSAIPVAPQGTVSHLSLVSGPIPIRLDRF